MNEQMMDGVVFSCMLATTLFASIILLAVIVQAVLQAKMLSEVGQL